MIGGVGRLGVNGTLGARAVHREITPIFGVGQPLYIRPAAHGTASGLSLANAAAPSQIPGFLKYFGPGTDVLFIADDGSYSIDGTLNTINCSTRIGTAAAPVRFLGVASDGVTPMDAVFNGTRDTASGPILVTNATTVNNNPTVSIPNTTGIVVGMVAQSTAIPNGIGATVLSIVPNTSVTLSTNATSGGSNKVFVFSTYLYRTDFETSGYDLFDLRGGGSYLEFHNFTVNNMGSVFLPTSNLNNCTFAYIDAVNFFGFFNSESDTFGTSVPIDTYTHTTLTFTYCTGTGFSGGFIRTWHNPKEISVDHCDGDAQKQIDVSFNIIFHTGGTGRLSTDPTYLAINPGGGPTFLTCTAKNAWYHSTAGNYPSSLYWNSDGFCDERTISGALYKDCTATGNTDGGFDLKSTNCVIDNPTASGNKFNFKLWGSGTVLSGSSTDPVKIAGTGSVGHIAYFGVADDGSGVNWTFNGTTFTGNTGNSAMLLDLETSATGANVLTLTSYTLSLQSGTVLIDTPTAPGTITVHATPPLPS